MREDWEIKKLSEITSFVGDGDWIESKDQSPGGIRLIQTGNIGEGTYKDKGERTKYISTDTFHRLHCTEVFAGDCLVSRLPDPIGRACILPKLNERMITAVDCSIIRFESAFLPQLFRYFSLSNRYQSYINTNATGTTRKRISRKRLEQVPVPVPPIAEQEKIVAELDCLTGIIEKKKQQLEELDKLAQSVFYDMFGDPIINEKGWEMKKLKDVAEIVGGSTPKTNVKEYWNGQNPWVAPAELHQNHYISSTERGISNEATKGLTLLPVGTVLLSSRAPIGKVSITTIPMYCNQGFKNVVCSNALNNEYVYHLLLNKTEYLNSLGTGATFKEISKKTTENIAIAVPPIELQEAFAAQSRAIEGQKELVKQSIAETETLFNSRMDYWFN